MSIFYSKEGVSGEMFLGYKPEYLILVEYLKKSLQQQVKIFTERGDIEELSEGNYKIIKQININDYIVG